MKAKMVCIALLVFTLTSCSAEKQTEMTENDAPVDSIKRKEGTRPIDYIPPGTNESSAKSNKRERKFYIR